MRILRIFETIIAWGFYCLFLITPLLFNPLRQIPSYELFEWNKMMFVYLATSVILSAWIGKMILQRKINLTRTPFDIPILLFLGSAILSTLFSIDRHVSIFGYYSRFHGGLLSIITYTVLYYAFVSNRNLINLKRLLLFALSSGLVVAMYGILEKFGIDAHMWVQDVRARVFSTLGQPNWLAAFLDILLPLGLAIGLQVFLQNKNLFSNISKTNFLTDKKARPLFLCVFISLVFYACLLFTRSRSGFLGFWVADAVFWIGVIYFSNKRSEVRNFLKEIKEKFSLRSNNKNILSSFLILHISFLILNFFITTPFSQYNKIATQQIFSSKPVVEETTAPVGDSVINVGITDSAKIRQIVWKGALDIAKAYPLFGTGPETFAYSYYKFRPVEHNLTSEWDFLYNRAHNEFLNIAATQGFLGLGIYLLLIFLISVWILIYAIKKPEQRLLLLAFLAAYTSIHITNFFGFSVVIVGLFFYLIPAFAYTLVNPHPPQIKAQNLPLLGIPQYLQLGGVGLLLAFLLITLARFWISDSLYARANSLSKQDNFTQSYPYIVSATQLRSDEPVYHDARADIAGNLAALAFSDNQATLGAELAQEAIQESKQALITSPQNVNFWKTRTRILFALGSVEPQFMEDAFSSIQIAEELAPTDAKIRYNAAIILGRLGKNEDAIKELQKTIDLKPDYRDAYIALSIFYQDEKQIDKARETLELVLKRINPNDDEVKKRLENLK